MRTCFAALLALSCAVAFDARRASNYDGAWWRRASADQRTGFLAGYIDCGAYEVGHRQLAAVPWNAVESKITSYYADHPSELQTPVATLLVRLGSPLAERRPQGGQYYPEKHGVFDGEYWRQATPDHRVGFVEGFLECRRTEGKSLTPPSHNEAWYVDRVSEWYGVRADDPSEIIVKRARTKIADVLRLVGTGRDDDREEARIG